MRISDWSSDVCSSDLHLSVDDVPYPEDAIRWKGVTSRETVVAIDPPRLLAMTWDGGKNGVARFEQIGRASCRERECKYGVDLGGRRIIKKKKTNIARTKSNKS